MKRTLQAIRETAQSVPFRRLRTACIFDVARQFGPEAAMEVARWAAKLQASGVVAFGMGGDELADPTVIFVRRSTYARQDGLRIVCHAGEIGGPDSVREAVELLGAERIGHGIAVMHDPALAESLIDAARRARNLPYEQFVYRSVGEASGQTGCVTLKDHPLPNFSEAWDSLVTLSTDDPGMFHTDLLKEYSLRPVAGLSTINRLLELAENSI